MMIQLESFREKSSLSIFAEKCIVKIKNQDVRTFRIIMRFRFQFDLTYSLIQSNLS